MGDLKYLRNQNEFSVRAKIDPKMKQTFTGTDGEAGFISAWYSENGDAHICLFIDMDDALGPDLQQGLNNMKKMVESRSN